MYCRWISVHVLSPSPLLSITQRKKNFSSISWNIFSHMIRILTHAPGAPYWFLLQDKVLWLNLRNQLVCVCVVLHMAHVVPDTAHLHVATPTKLSREWNEWSRERETDRNTWKHCIIILSESLSFFQLLCEWLTVLSGIL